MRISVIGLGYVGCVSAACFAHDGHDVIGVDVQQDKVDLINKGTATIVEERVGDLVRDAVEAGTLRATTDLREAVAESDLSIVCVGTPSAPNGSLATTYLERVSTEIGQAIAACTERHTVVFRSTMLPGTCEDRLIPLLESASGLKVGADFGVAVNPEYLREGSSVRDFYEPPKTVIGEFDQKSGEVVLQLYRELAAPVFTVPIRVGEMTKYIDNSFHALKVSFGNEIGALCNRFSVDTRRAVDIFLADTKLNISPAYLRPGFAFGGSCLPKDVRGLTYAARRADVATPLLDSILDSNSAHLDRAFDAATASTSRKVGFLGLSFKAGTDDLRESPLVDLAERLIGKGKILRIHDSQVSFSHLIGANRAYVEERLPHVRDLLTESAAEVAHYADVLVVGVNNLDAQTAVANSSGELVLDLSASASIEQVSTGWSRYVAIV